MIAMSTGKENKSVAISFRLTESEYKPYKDILGHTELTKTEFFRNVFLNKQYTFNVKERRPVDYHRLIFYFNKASNNINQIAKRLNEDNKKGIISQKTYEKGINELITIQSNLQRLLNDC